MLVAELPAPVLITRAEALKDLVKRLVQEPVVAVDTESNSLHAYREQVCLLQFSTPQVDYLVDQDGMIDFPVIGKIKIEGLSPDELRLLLRDELSEYLKDPIINIRLRNFTITVLGQVARPGTYPINGEQITILEGLGLAGDLTLRGKRENVLVIRDFNGTKVYNRLDLTSKNLVKSPVYYLTQNDVVYVEPNNTGIRETSVGPSTSITITIISMLVTSTALIITRI